MNRPYRKIMVLGVVVMAGCLLSSCEPATRHKVLSTIFDGVPQLPPKDEYCENVISGALLEPDNDMTTAFKDPETGAPDSYGRSIHEPYEEKLCNDCHSEDKNENDGFVEEKQKLCYVCHEKFPGGFLHGPVAVGDCTACHDPHSSQNPSLLIAEKEKVCTHCHKESRLASEMHQSISDHSMNCQECHDPHAGHLKYFLK